MASTSSASLTPTANGNFKPIHRKSTDIGWQWSSYRDESKKTILCDFCGHPTGGITRAKQHQLGIKGEVKSCKKTPEGVKELLKDHFVSKQAAKEQKKRGRPSQDELGSLAQLSPIPISFAIPATGQFSATERGRGFYDLKDTRPC